MKILVLGASGRTGRLVTEECLRRGLQVRAVARSPAALGELAKSFEGLEIVTAAVNNLGPAGWKNLLKDCSAAVCCLGHNLSFQGMFLPPHRLVTQAVRDLTASVCELRREKPFRLVLMNSSGVRNPALHEKVSKAQAAVLFLLRCLLPPHSDNELAAEYLLRKIGSHNSAMEWVSVRPDALTDDDKGTDYEAFPSPVRSAIFDSGKISRRQTACFMTDLLCRDELWQKWRFQMPVVYGA